jgi:hypothetical protein
MWKYRRYSMLRLFRLSIAIAILVPLFAVFVFAKDTVVEYKVLATKKTSTTQKEMNEAAEAGFRYAGVMGGETTFGGSEVVTIMYRTPDMEPGRYSYKLLATSKTSTMQKEMQEAGDEGYEYKGQTVYGSPFGGREIVVILEMDRNQKNPKQYEYLLLATKRTSTMQSELLAAGAEGFEFVGLTLGESKFGGAEVISILRRSRQ